MVDARREAVGVRARPLSRDFSKRLEGGGAENGAERRAEPRAVKGGAPRYKGRTEREARPSRSWSRWRWSPLGASLPSSWFMLAPVSPVVQFFFSSLGSCARGPASGLLVGDADGRRSSAGCVVDLRVRMRRVPERVRRPLKGGLSLLLYGCCGAVSHK